MYLKRLSLSGFKSFADPTDFLFNRGTTVIVGPNGCGKSNVVDAFRWVLGERSAKGLRGQEMLDVIFKGTRNRAQLSRAEVSLCFDNSDGRLPIEFQEVEVTRRLYRSGESEYLVNKRKCRLKDILRLFTDTGIGTEGYSILEQGSVDGFLQASAQDRRSIFEEAAGISRFRGQKKQAIRQLERTTANVERLRDIYGEVERRLRSVKIQAGKARRFLEDRERFVRLRGVLADNDLRSLRDERQHLTFDLTLSGLRRGWMGQVVNTLSSRRQEFKEGVDSAAQQLSEMRQSEVQSRMNLDRSQQRLQHIEELRADLQQAALRREEQRAEMEGLERESKGRRQVIRDRSREQISLLRRLRQELQESRHEHTELARQKEELESYLKEAKEDVVSHLFKETRLSNDNTARESERRGLESMRERRRTEAEEFSAAVDEHLQLQATLQAQLQEILQVIEQEQESVGVLQDELDRRTRLLDDTQRTLSEMRERFEADQARLRFLQELEESREGVGQGAQSLLASEHPLSKDILGLLADAIEAQPEVAPMVDVVLGDYSETVVLRSDTPMQDRARIIGKIVAEEAVSFFQVGPVQRSPFRSSDADQRLLDLIDFEPCYGQALEGLFGDVMVAGSLEEALRRRDEDTFGRRWVTPDGLLLEPWGGVSLPGRNRKGLVSRHAEIQRLQVDLEERGTHLRRVSDDAAALELGITSRQGELRRHEEVRQRAQLEGESLRRQLTSCEAELQRGRQRLETVESEIAEIDSNILRLGEELQELQAELARVTEERGLLEKRVEEREHSLPEISARFDSVAQQVSGLRVDATQAEERLLASRREELGVWAELQERAERRRYLEQEDLRDAERLHGFDDEEQHLGSEQASIRAELEELSEHLSEGERQLQRSKDQLEESEYLAQRVRSHDEELREVREGALLRENECRMTIEGTRQRFFEDFERELNEAPLGEWRYELLHGLAEATADESIPHQLAPPLTAAQQLIDAQPKDGEDPRVTESVVVTGEVAEGDLEEAVVEAEVADEVDAATVLPRGDVAQGDVAQGDVAQGDVSDEDPPSQVSGADSDGSADEETLAATAASEEVGIEQPAAVGHLDSDALDEELLQQWRNELEEIGQRLKKNSNVNLEAVQELEELEERHLFLQSQIEDLEQAQERLGDTIEELNKKSRELFAETFEIVRSHFRELFVKMFNGGQADLVLEEGVDILEAGIEVRARPPGKRISSLRLLSGGEKALTAISVLFALFRTRPSPFCLLDEVDAPLDEANIRRFVRILDDFTGDTQFLVISHSKVTMAEGETLYGVTMEEEGVSKKVVVKMDEVDTSGAEASIAAGGKKEASKKNVLFVDKPVPDEENIGSLVDSDESFPTTSPRVEIEPPAPAMSENVEADSEEPEFASIADLPTVELPNRLPAEVVEGAEEES